MCCAVLTRSEWEQSALHRLSHIPHPPETLYYEGTLPSSELTLLAVVGSRQYSNYGKQVVTDLIAGLTQYPVGIVSGLARGIDGLAHEAALKAGLYTLAIPGSGLDRSVLYPRAHRGLADRILTSDGGLLSELTPQTKAARWTFPQRNRLMAGLTVATLLIEATERSGTLITARMAVDYDRELLVVPGNIYTPSSAGVHQFLKLGATPVTHSQDIVDHLGLSQSAQVPDVPLPTLSPLEQTVLEHLSQPIDLDTLCQNTAHQAHELTGILMKLELDGYIRHENGLYYRRI